MCNYASVYMGSFRHCCCTKCFAIEARCCVVSFYCIIEVMLNCSVLTAPEPVSQTRNVGSIKAMFASRAQAKAVQNHVVPGDATDDAETTDS